VECQQRYSLELVELAYSTLKLHRMDDRILAKLSKFTARRSGDSRARKRADHKTLTVAA